MQYQKKPTPISPQVKVNLMQMQMKSQQRVIQPREIQPREIQPRAFAFGGSMIDAVKKSSKGCKSCGG